MFDMDTHITPGMITVDCTDARALAHFWSEATGAPITSIDGQELVVQADSLCVHGDNPEAISLSRRIIEQLGHVGVAVQVQP